MSKRQNTRFRMKEIKAVGEDSKGDGSKGDGSKGDASLKTMPNYLESEKIILSTIDSLLDNFFKKSESRIKLLTRHPICVKEI